MYDSTGASSRFSYFCIIIPQGMLACDFFSGPFITKVFIVAPPSTEKFLLKVEDYVPGHTKAAAEQAAEEESSDSDDEETAARKKRK